MHSPPLLSFMQTLWKLYLRTTPSSKFIDDSLRFRGRESWAASTVSLKALYLSGKNKRQCLPQPDPSAGGRLLDGTVLEKEEAKTEPVRVSPKPRELPTLDSCRLRLKRWTMITQGNLQTKQSAKGRFFFLNRFLGKSVAKHFDDCHGSPKNFPGNLSKLRTTSLFHREMLQSLTWERAGGEAGRART